MYGLVNKAIVELIRSRFGEDTWVRVRTAAGVENDAFIGLESYPDAVTYKLVGAASEVLGLTAAQVLEAFGEYWVLYTGREGYGPLLESSGSTFQEALFNLDSLHTRVGMMMPALQPPSFLCTQEPDGLLRVRYTSTRAGLAPMVLGLLRGLGQLYRTHVEVSHIAKKETEGHDEFLIRTSALRKDMESVA
jgi:hypothetical protein